MPSADGSRASAGVGKSRPNEAEKVPSLSTKWRVGWRWMEGGVEVDAVAPLSQAFYLVPGIFKDSTPSFSPDTKARASCRASALISPPPPPRRLCLGDSGSFCARRGSEVSWH